MVRIADAARLTESFAMLRTLLDNFMLACKLRGWRWALLIAVLSDALGFGVVLVPPLQWVLDVFTAVALFVMLGFPWGILIALAVEVVPGLALFPAWTLVVLALAGAKNGPGRLKHRGQDLQPPRITKEPE